MKNKNPTILVTIFWLIFLISITLKLDAVDSSTVGLVLPNSKMPTSQQNKVPPDKAQINPPLVCVDSGIQGRRCGITAINFCKRNPQALNCQIINGATTTPLK
jgi:hypothetical protein